jgi:hypothetical protein
MNRIATALCLATTITACTVEDAPTIGDQAPAPNDWTMLASLELPTGLEVEFYEPQPGALLVMQDAPAGVPALHGQPRAVDLYRAFAPDVPVPTALAAAQARADDLGGGDPDSDPTAERRRIADILADYGTATAAMSVGYIDNQSCDDHWFADEMCFDAWDWNMCLLNHWNGAYATTGSEAEDLVEYAVCADIGDVTLKIWVGDGSGGIWDVPEGHYRHYFWSCGIIGWEYSSRADVYNATNNRFHFYAGYDD